jgi:peptidoglycan/LPS O-acetylase OafA/YrhL
VGLGDTAAAAGLPLISALGSAGFTIYLLHPLVILPVREHGWIARVNTPLEQIGLLLCAVLLAIVLGSAPVRRLVRPLTRPPITWLFARTPLRQQPATVPLPAQRSPAEQLVTHVGGGAAAPATAGAPTIAEA